MKINNQKWTKHLGKRCGVMLVLMTAMLSWAGPSYAFGLVNGGYVTPPEPPKYGLYSETVEDMRVKVHGGYIRVVRNRKDKAWHINQRWAPVYKGSYADPSFQAFARGNGKRAGNSSGQFNVQINTGDINADSPYLSREGYIYLNTAKDQYTLVDYPKLTITERDTTKGSQDFLWQNREGDWIHYNADGFIQSYGDKNNVQVSFKYNANDNISDVFDTLGKQILWYEYDTANRISVIRDYSGRKVQYFYTTAAKLDRVIDVNNNTWRYEYSGAFLTKKIDPEGRETNITGGQVITSVLDQDGIGIHYKYEYNKTKKEFYRQEKTTAGKVTESWFDEEGELIRQYISGRTIRSMVKSGNTKTITDLNGLKTIEQYDTFDNLIKRSYADGSSISYKYDTQYSNVTQMTNENGVVTDYEYDDNGNLIRMTEAVGLAEQRVTEYDYDIYGNQTLIKSLADGNTAEASIVMTYDDFGNLETYTDAEDHVTEYLEYDAIGNQKKMKDARGNIWQYDYDANGNLTREETPLGFVTEYGYDKVNNLTTVTDAHLKVSKIGYDKRNRPGSVTNQLLDTSTLTYNDNDQIETLTNALGHVISMEYNLSGDLIKITDPSGDEISLDYGYAGSSLFKGQINSITYPTFEESFTYDKRYRTATSNQSSSDQDTPARNNSFSYDKTGNRDIFTDAKNRTADNESDALNRSISLLDTAQQLTQQAYDNRNNVTQVTNARNIAIRQYQYDKNNRLIKELLPDNSVLLESSYDPNGNLKQTIDGKGQVAIYSYDLDGRFNQVDYYANLASSANTANPQKTVTFSYDKLNRLTGYDDGTTSALYVYDDAGQITGSSTNYGSFSLSHGYTYYPSNLKKTYTSPDNITYSYQYDSAGKFQSVSIPGQGNYTINQYKWNHPERVTLPGGGKIIVDYDGYMRGKRIQALDPASNPILDLLYTFDPLDNIEVREALEAKYQYDYDNADRLITVDTTATDQTQTSTESYGYDPVGNRENFNQNTWSYDDNDRLQQRGDWTYDYDDNGSQTQQTNAVTGEIKTYVYNLENRLSEIRDENNNLIASYSYDPFGKRISKTIGNTTTYYYYSEDGLVAETNNSGTITTSYHWQMNTPWGTDPMFIRQGGQYGFYVTDHLGTPQRVVGSNGAVLWSAEYDAFGEASVSSNSIVSNLRFPGQYFDAESGLHYNYFRYYDAGIGRYVTSDPIGLAGGINAYAYVGGNPLILVDPMGLLWSPPQWLVDGAAGFGDSLTFGATAGIRKIAGISGGVNPCSSAYRAGEWAEIGIELLLTGGSSALVRSAAKASRSKVRNEFARRTAHIPRNGKFLHHNNPLFGHPGGATTLFPTGGLPGWISHSKWNANRLLTRTEHMAAHRRLRKQENFSRQAVNPKMTGGRAAVNEGRNLLECGCD